MYIPNPNFDFCMVRIQSSNNTNYVVKDEFIPNTNVWLEHTTNDNDNWIWVSGADDVRDYYILNYSFELIIRPINNTDIRFDPHDE